MDELIKYVREFAEKRDWDQFHSPKNLSMALSVEAAELMEHLQWLTEDQSRRPDQILLERIKEEIGDVQIYLARLADQLGIDPLEAAREKLRQNEIKYPIEKAKGSSKKYSEL
jgi:dCTP diphosphatase